MYKYCENCQIKIIETYGSGRFCCSLCARSFSSKCNKEEADLKRSNALKGRTCWNGKPFQKGFDARRRLLSDEDRVKAIKIVKQKREFLYETSEFDDLPHAEKRRRILKEQDFKCKCGILEWQNTKLTLELHHRNGDGENETRENLEILCPNCHSITFDYRNKKINGHVSQLVEESVSKTES